MEQTAHINSWVHHLTHQLKENPQCSFCLQNVSTSFRHHANKSGTIANVKTFYYLIDEAFYAIELLKHEGSVWHVPRETNSSPRLCAREILPSEGCSRTKHVKCTRKVLTPRTWTRKHWLSCNLISQSMQICYQRRIAWIALFCEHLLPNRAFKNLNALMTELQRLSLIDHSRYKLQVEDWRFILLWSLFSFFMVSTSKLCDFLVIHHSPFTIDFRHHVVIRHIISWHRLLLLLLEGRLEIGE